MSVYIFRPWATMYLCLVNEMSKVSSTTGKWVEEYRNDKTHYRRYKFVILVSRVTIRYKALFALKVLS